jgi:DNA-binding transcriptional LysR family regulator
MASRRGPVEIGRGAPGMGVANPTMRELLKRKGISLDRLVVLVAVHEAGSLIKAAGGVKVRADQYSRQIRELEEFLKFDLTRREGRELALNEQGIAFAQMTREYFRGLEDFVQRGRKQERTYRLGAGESLLQWIVIPGLQALSSRRNPVAFRLSNLQNSQIALGLGDLTLDFGLLRKESVRDPLDSWPLGSVQYVLCVPRPLMKGIDKDDWRGALEKLPLAMHLETAYVQGEFEAQIEAAGVHPQVRLRCDTFPSAMAALRTGAYATLMIRFPGIDMVPANVETIPLPCLDHTHREIHLAWNPRLLSVRPDAVQVRNALYARLAWQDL